jgi:outer membrane protein assembly factor BamB
MKSSATILILIAVCAGATLGESFPLPHDAPSVDVTKPPFNAVGDGATDCTEAFNKAIQAARKGGHGFVYVPDGTYLLSDGGEKGDPQSALITWGGQKKITLWGQSRQKTILRLKDNSPTFGDPQKSRWVIQAGKAGSNDFFNGLHNITVDTGKGNPGAKAVKFHTSNQGSITNVLIRSGDGAGLIGLDLSAAGPGPGLARDIRVEGFDRGISIVYMSGFSMVFENIELVNQREVGFYNERLPCSIRGLRSRNTVPAMRLAQADSFVVLVDAVLEGGAADAAAIENLQDGGMFVRNALVSGYATAISSTVGGKKSTVAPGKVEEWTSHGVRTCVPGSAGRSLGLPVEAPPGVAWGEPEKDWISVKAFKPRVVKIRDGNKMKDVEEWSGAIQEAIDSGKRVVYFPNGEYNISRPIIVRGKVQRVFGSQSLLRGVVAPDSPALQEIKLSPIEAMAASADMPDEEEEGSQDNAPMLRASFPGFRIEDGEGAVMFEDLIATNGSQINRWFEHASTRTLVVRRCSLGGYHNSVTGGKVFFEDTVISNLHFDRQKVWMRQWNPEAKGPDRYNCINKGSDLWILGLKTEGPKVVIATLEGGRTEVLGGYVYPNRGSEGNPAFICVDGQQSLSYAEADGWISPDALYEEQVRETRDGKTYSLWRGDVPKRGGAGTRLGGLFVPLYAGWAAPQAEAAHVATPEPAKVLRPQAAPAPAQLTQELRGRPMAHARGGLGRTGHYDTKSLRVSADKLGDNAKPLWTAQTEKNAGVPVVSDGVAYFGDHRGNMSAVEVATGKSRWKIQLSGDACGAPAVAYGQVYIGAGNDMHALNVADGAVRWRFPTDSMTCYEPAAVDGMVLFVNGNGILFAVNALTGEECYRVLLNREPASGPAVDGGVAFVGLRGGVQAVRVADGEPLWRFRCGASVTAPIAADGRVYAAAERIYALDAANGKPVWDEKYFKPTDPRVALADGRLYLGAPRAQGLYVVEASSGKLLDTIQARFGKYNWPLAVMNGPAIAGGVLYFHQQNSWHVGAIDLKTRQTLYTLPGFGPRASCVPADGHVLCAAGWTGLHAFGTPAAGVDANSK